VPGEITVVPVDTPLPTVVVEATPLPSPLPETGRATTRLEVRAMGFVGADGSQPHVWPYLLFALALLSLLRRQR
jgi:MYXO-CTERM domain-containing protein